MPYSPAITTPDVTTRPGAGYEHSRDTRSRILAEVGVDYFDLMLCGLGVRVETFENSK